MHYSPARSSSRLFPLLIAASATTVPLAAQAAVTEPPVMGSTTRESVPKPTGTAEIGVVTSRGFTAMDDTLAGLFKARGETIDPVKDAQTAPGTFSPQCGFTGQLVLRGGGCKVGLGWYNATAGSTTPPPETEIYPLVPAMIPTCPMTPLVPDPTMMCCDDGDFCPLAQYDTTQAPQQHRWSMPAFSADNIRADKRYKGGQVGFVLRGVQAGGQCNMNKYSQLELNQKSPSGAPWIGAIVWQSTVDPSSYYLGFEDLPTTATSWQGAPTGMTNDGDFNDFVFYVSGVTCKGGGKTCDTGMKGICAAGVTQCSSGEIINCTSVVKPSTEVCDGIDNDCDGEVDQGNPCPNNQICDKGQCVGHCATGEFQCPPGLVCDNDFCRDPRCVGKECPTGQVCVAGNCQGGCEGVVCPHGQSCTAGFCIDLCRDVKCSGSQVCENGICLPSCTCRGCDTGQICSETSGRCVDTGCEKANCTLPAQFCMGGSCKDNCLGVICPGGQECSGGLCNPSVSTSMGTGGAVGTLKDASVDVPIFTGSGGGPGFDGGHFDGPNGGTGSGGSGAMGSISACSCETASSGGSVTWLSMLGFASIIALRARRRVR
jgi:hypothetical protein